MYKEILDVYLLDFPLPEDILHCRTSFCTRYEKDNAAFYYIIVDVLRKAGNECISKTKCGKTRKTVPGWNDYVEGYFCTALFWYKLWQDGGRPESGVIADMRGTKIQIGISGSCVEQRVKVITRRVKWSCTKKT